VVTNAQYERFKEKHERSEASEDDNDPVVNMSWEDAQSYCAWLSEEAERPIRLPSEAEWECIAQAGKGPWCCMIYMVGNQLPAPDDPEVRGVPAVQMESMLSNPWGFQGLSDSPAEWCADEWFPDHGGAPADGSARTGEGSTTRVVRGMRASTGVLKFGLGVSRGWFHIGPCARSGESISGSFRFCSTGFRPAFSTEEYSHVRRRHRP